MEFHTVKGELIMTRVENVTAVKLGHETDDGNDTPGEIYLSNGHCIRVSPETAEDAASHFSPQVLHDTGATQ